MARSERKFTSRTQSIFSVLLLLLFLILAWVFSGIFIVTPNDEVVIMRFGKYRRTLQPGINWVPHFIDSSFAFNVKKISIFSDSVELLTKDGDLVACNIKIAYRIKNPRDFLLKAQNPLTNLELAATSALSREISHFTSREILSSNYEQIAILDEKLLTNLRTAFLAEQLGLEIVKIHLEEIHPPSGLTESFNSIARAREEVKNKIALAGNYRKQAIDVAHREAKNLLNDAEIYKERTILNAKVDVAEFFKILPSYTKAPQITQNRLYLDTMNAILYKNKVILLDVKGNNTVRLSFEKPSEDMVAGSKEIEKKSMIETLMTERKLRSDISERMGYPKGENIRENF